LNFYDATNEQGLCQLVDTLCDSTDTSYSRVKKTREINTAYKEIVGDIVNADGTWQFDDTNYTDFPIGTYTLVDGQSKYSFNDQFLQMESVEIMNADGNYQIIKPIDQDEYSKVTPLEEAFETDGLPTCYDKIADDTIKLYPAPDDGTSVTLASGLKIKFRRTAKTFTVASDTSADTTEAGFATNHEILAYKASIPYCIKYHPRRVVGFLNEIARLEKKILIQYSTREQDKRKIIRNKPIRYI